MANIEYKSKYEKFFLPDLNPYLLSLDEVTGVISDLVETSKLFELDMYEILLDDHLSDEIEANEHLNKIIEGSTHSSPFDEKILKNKQVKSVDELNIYDFRLEENFRKCLRAYFSFLKCNASTEAYLKVFIEREYGAEMK